VFGLVFLAPLRSSAARAARSRASSAPTFVSGQLCLWHHLVRFVGSLQLCAGANKAVAVISQAKLTRNRCGSEGGAEPLLAKRRAGGARSQERHSIIAWHLEALMQSPARNIDESPMARLATGSGPKGACLDSSGALETERRPRGASRASSAPTFVSGQLCLWHHLVRFVGSLQIWVGANKAVAVISQAKLARNRWEQSLLAKRRTGGARSQERHSIIAWHSEALMQSPARNIEEPPICPSCNRVGAERCMP